MLFVHTYSEPMRLMEEIRYWKMQERENAASLRSHAGLSPETVSWLAEWERAFGEMEAAADRWLGQAVHRQRGKVNGSNSVNEAESVSGMEGVGGATNVGAADGADQAETIAAGAAVQSQRWAAALMEWSRRLGGRPAAPGGSGQGHAALDATTRHMARDSEYFLGVLNGQAGAKSFARSVLPEGTWSKPAAETVAIAGSAHTHTPSDPDATPAAANAAAHPVPIGGHTLPPLPYAYDALEPHLDAETIRIHHDILHKNYVEGLNAAERKLAEARKTNDFDLVKHWERELAFNGAGHYLHTIYFAGMGPDGGGRPGHALAAQIERDFGGFDAFRNHFAAAATKVEGSGWAHLVWAPRSGRLQILQAEKHQNLTQWDDIPLLSIDVWEHSYYLKYKNERNKYIDAWFELVRWPYAERRFVAARAVAWKPY